MSMTEPRALVAPSSTSAATRGGELAAENARLRAENAHLRQLAKMSIDHVNVASAHVLFFTNRYCHAQLPCMSRPRTSPAPELK
eukprot:COSAG06_NODE_1831_length_8265_cov_5.188219_2_plen_84_part_00